MAVSTLRKDIGDSNETATSPTAQAFMQAFRDFHTIDNDPKSDTESPEYYLAMYAFEGAKEGATMGLPRPYFRETQN